MKNMYKAAIIAALGLASVTAQAQNSDLKVGLTDQSLGTPTDYVIDIGMTGSALVTAANANGGTYDLTSMLNGSAINTYFAADANAFNNVQFGAVGGYTTSNPKNVFQTVASGQTPAVLTAGNLVNNAANQAITITAGQYVSATSTGFSYLAAGLGGNGGSSVLSYTGTTPIGTLSSGVLSMDLWENTRTSSTGPAIGWVKQGTLTVDLNADTLTFTTGAVAVPEPTSIAAFGGAGLLLLSLRNKFRKA